MDLKSVLLSVLFLIGLTAAQRSATEGRHYRHSRSELDLTDQILISQPDCVQGETPILVHTAAVTQGKYYDRRQTIRRTWAREAANQKMRVIFVIGLPRGGASHPDQSRLQAESDKYQDILQFGFIDDYYNLTLKAIAELKWTQKHCDQSRYVVKTDDDVLLNMPALHQAVQGGKFQPGFTGKVMNIPAYRRPGQKWYMPRKYYTQESYTFLLGFGYVLSMDRLGELLATIENYQGPILDIDDLFMTGVAANQARIKRHNDRRFQFYCGPDPCTLERSLAIVACGDSRQNEAMYHAWKQADSGACYQPAQPFGGRFGDLQGYLNSRRFK